METHRYWLYSKQRKNISHRDFWRIIVTFFLDSCLQYIGFISFLFFLWITEYLLVYFFLPLHRFHILLLRMPHLSHSDTLIVVKKFRALCKILCKPIVLVIGVHIQWSSVLWDWIQLQSQQVLPEPVRIQNQSKLPYQLPIHKLHESMKQILSKLMDKISIRIDPVPILLRS